MAITYQVKCAQCRERGAIGIFHKVDTTVMAESIGHADAVFRDLYECHAPVVVKAGFPGAKRAAFKTALGASVSGTGYVKAGCKVEGPVIENGLHVIYYKLGRK